MTLSAAVALTKHNVARIFSVSDSIAYASTQTRHYGAVKEKLYDHYMAGFNQSKHDSIFGLAF